MFTSLFSSICLYVHFSLRFFALQLGSLCTAYAFTPGADIWCLQKRDKVDLMALVGNIGRDIRVQTDKLSLAL